MNSQTTLDQLAERLTSPGFALFIMLSICGTSLFFAVIGFICTIRALF